MEALTLLLAYLGLPLAGPADPRWVKQFQSRLKPRTRTYRYWQLLRKCWPEDQLLNMIHHACGSKSISEHDKTFRRTELERIKKLKDAKQQLDKSIETLEKVSATLEKVYPEIGAALYMKSPVKDAALDYKLPTAQFDELVAELRSYARSFQYHLEIVETLRRSFEVPGNLAIATLARFFIACTGEPHWLEFSDLVNMAFGAHGRREEKPMTPEAAQQLYSRFQRLSVRDSTGQTLELLKYFPSV
jgi:hypothetical protein